MRDETMEAAVKALVGDSRFDELVPYYLESAKAAMVTHLYPFEPERDWFDVPERYCARTVEIAAYLVAKRGAEGEVQHIESGVSRTYESAAIPKGYFDGIPSFAAVPR